MSGMDRSMPSEANQDLVCDVGHDLVGLTDGARRAMFRTACAAPPFCEHDDGMKYCVLHIPRGDKHSAFEEAIEKKLENPHEELNFSGVWFPENWSRFRAYEFTVPVSFDYAVFSGGVDFSDAVFPKGASFIRTLFKGESLVTQPTFFRGARFQGPALFNMTVFDGQVSFNEAEFEEGVLYFVTTFNDEALFNYVTFHRYAIFAVCTFASRVHFFGDPAFANDPFVTFYLSRMLEPESFSIRQGNLRPSWFINVDSVRKFNFSNVHWYGAPSGPSGGLKEEFNYLSTKAGQLAAREELGSDLVEYWIPAQSELKYRTLARAYRELSLNAEEGHRYRLAAELRYLSAEAQRRQSWRGLVPLSVSWWHWLLSGHSERPLIAFGWLVVIWLGFAVLFTLDSLLGLQLGFESVQSSTAPLDVPSALAWSLGAMSRVIEGPDRPVGFGTDTTEALVFLEGILGPLQFALLALAIRRKVMR